MVKLRYFLALACYLAIPVAVLAGGGLFLLIDPEMARGHADYVRTYRLLDLARRGVLAAAAGLALGLWVACCYLVLASRGRSRRWLALAAAGPIGFSVIATLGDQSPAPGDHYQRFLHRLGTGSRVALEIAVCGSVWGLAHTAVVVERELMIQLESRSTGTPAAAIIAQQSASSGMWAAGEGMEALYLVPLIYLLWPVLFNLAGWLFMRRPHASERRPTGARE